MERRSLVLVLLISFSAAGADFLQEQCACVSEDRAAILLGDGVDHVASGYGIGCGNHHQNLTECTPCDHLEEDSTMPDFCKTEWCWVDPDNCSLNYQRSIDFRGLAKSYAACGKTVPPSNSPVDLTKGLKFCILPNTGGWRGTYLDNFGEPIGPVPQFMKEAVGRWEDHTFINKTTFREHCDKYDKEKLGRDFDCCVWATALGICDVCLTEATINTNRSMWGVDFVHTVTESRKVVTKRTEDLFGAFAAPWEPFTTDAWLLILAVPLPALIGISIIHFRVSRKGPSCGGCRPLPLDPSDPDEWLMCECCCGFQLYKRRRVGRCGQVSLFGLVFWFEVALLLYSAANLDHHLSMDRYDHEVDTLAEVVSRGLKVCMQRTDADSFQSDGNNLYFVRDPSDDKKHIEKRADLFDLMDDGKCEVVITTSQDLEKEHSLKNHCHKVMVGENLHSVPMGIPISPRISRELMQKLQELRDEGVYARLVVKPPENKCNQNPDDEATFTWKAIVLFQVVVGIIIFAGCIIDVYSLFRNPSKSEIPEEPPIDAPVSPSVSDGDQTGEVRGQPAVIEQTAHLASAGSTQSV